jgi:hypothetical protein
LPHGEADVVDHLAKLISTVRNTFVASRCFWSAA